MENTAAGDEAVEGRWQPIEVEANHHHLLGIGNITVVSCPEPNRKVAFVHMDDTELPIIGLTKHKI